MTNPETSYRHVGHALYLLALLLIASPLVDMFIGVYPPHIGQVQWRAGVLSIMPSTLQSPLVGVVCIVAAASLLGHRRVLTVLGFVAAVVAVLLVVCAGTFTLDALQLRGRIPAAQVGAYQRTMVKAVFTYILETVVLAVVALGCLRGWRRQAPRAEIPLIRQAPAAQD